MNLDSEIDELRKRVMITAKLSGLHIYFSACRPKHLQVEESGAHSHFSHTFTVGLGRHTLHVTLRRILSNMITWYLQNPKFAF